MEVLIEGSGLCSIAKLLTSLSLPRRPTWTLTVWMLMSRDLVRKRFYYVFNKELINSPNFSYNEFLFPQMASLH